MASGSAALALKAAALVSVFALLVVPSLGRCGHSPAPPPPPASTPPPPVPLPPPPAPAPGSGPAISCDDCRSQCYTTCQASIASHCSSDCDDIGETCDSCKITMIERCKGGGYCTGSCDCNNNDYSELCRPACSVRYCDDCQRGYGQTCRDDCSKQYCSICIP